MIDESQQSIVVTVASFDSALFASFVEHLEREYGIRAYADDNEAWAPKQPDWQLVVSIRDVPYKAKVAQLINLTGHLLQELGVALFPVRAQMDEIALLVPLHFLHHSQASSQVKSSQVKSSQVGTIIELLAEESVLVEFADLFSKEMATIPLRAAQLLKLAK